MEVLGLIRLRERVMEGDARSVISETSKVGLGALGLLNGHGYDLHLVVGKADFNLKLVGHDELVSLNTVVVVLLLLLHLVALLVHHLLLHLLLLDLLKGKERRFQYAVMLESGS